MLTIFKLFLIQKYRVQVIKIMSTPFSLYTNRTLGKVTDGATVGHV